MADQYGLFWNSINSDRTYDADSFAEWLRKFFTTGIFNGEMQVTPSTGMTVSVAPGYANLEGKVRFFDTIQTFTLDPASGSYPRIDTIVVRSDSTNRIITTEYVKGAYSGNNPVPTAPVRTGSIYEIVLAQILVGAGITAIMAEDITDTRPDDDLCGWVTSTVESVPMDQITTQMQADFLAWYDRMKGQLSQDAAGHLQAEIDSTNDNVSTMQGYIQELYSAGDSALSSITPKHDPTISDTGHAKGDIFYWQYGADFYQVDLVRATQDIDIGEEIVEGRNVERINVAGQIETLTNGLTNVTYITISAGRIKGWCYKVGKICMLTITDGTSETTAANTVLFTLPQGYRPVYQVEFVDTYGKIRMRISENGQITNVEQSTTFIRGACVFIAQ